MDLVQTTCEIMVQYDGKAPDAHIRSGDVHDGGLERH